MPAPLRVVLSEESDRTLQELRVASRVAQHIKDRAHMVRLNAHWIAQKAALTLKQTRRFTVVVQDNCSIHKRDIVRQHWQHWQDQGLVLFFLPPYSAKMNRIEDQWHQLKVHEIAGQMFDDEYDLAMVVIEGMESRSQIGGYALEHFRFNSA